MSQKPFDISFVLRLTRNNMLKAIDTSIAKTATRISEFDGQSEKSAEILQTLSRLEQYKRLIKELE